MVKIIRKHKCKFQGGKPVLEDPPLFAKECSKLEGKDGYVSIFPWRKMKTGRQNRYYRGVVIARLADYWGTTNQEAHEAVSREHLSYKPGNPEMPALIKSTALTEWSAVDWENYMEFLRRWAASEFGVYIELPNEVDLEKLPQIYH